MTKAKMSVRKKPSVVKALRLRSGLSQQDFWKAVYVTQSGGSRYETGRAIPRPVQELIRIVHNEGIRLEDVTRKNIMAALALRAEKPEKHRMYSAKVAKERILSATGFATLYKSTRESKRWARRSMGRLFELFPIGKGSKNVGGDGFNDRKKLSQERAKGIAQICSQAKKAGLQRR